MQTLRRPGRWQERVVAPGRAGAVQLPYSVSNEQKSTLQGVDKHRDHFFRTMAAPTTCCLAVAPQAARHSGTLASRQPPTGPRHLRRVPEQQPQRRRGPRLQQPTAAAGSSSDSGDAAESPDAAFATCQSCMDMFCERQQSSDLDTIVAYLPDTVIDRLIERKRSKL